MSQRGQATPEYVAVVLLVALVLAAAGAVVSDPGLGRSLLQAMRRALCVVSGYGCESGPRKPCVLESRSKRERASVSIAVVRVGADATILRERRSDGMVAVTLVRAGSAGADVSLGADFALKLGGRSLGFGGEIRALGLAGLGGGRTWVVPDDAAADRLVGRLGERRSPLAALVRGVLGKDPKVRDPDFTVSEGFTEGSLRGKLGTGRFGAEADTEVRDAVGTRTERATGRRTYYIRENRGATGILLAKAFGAVAGVAKGSLALGVTVDRAGAPVELSATAAGTLGGSRGVWRKLRGLTGGGGRSEVDARLDLRDPDNAAAVSGFLAALRRPDRVSELVGTAQALGDRMRDYSDLQARRYRVDTQRTGAEGRVKVVGGLGGRFERALESARLVGAWERPPGGVWQPRLDCVPGQATV